MLKRSTSVFAHESLLGIEHLVGLPVAREESRQSQHVAVAGAADDQRARDAALEQSDAAQDQRAHDALAELGFRDEDVAQPRRWHDQRLDRLQRARVHERRPTGELVQLSDERAGAVRDDRPPRARARCAA